MNTSEVVNGVIGAVIGLAFFGWSVYAAVVILNHFSVWPFSYLGS